MWIPAGTTVVLVPAETATPVVGQPQVKVSSTGNACGTLGASGPIGVTQPIPPPQPPPRRHERVWTIGNPPHLLRTGTPPRT